VKAGKIREMNVDELKGKEKELAEQLFKLRLSKAIGQLDGATRIRDTRRDIARIKTVLRQKQAAAKA
jgi:large subunit ribosomal protein L29